MAFTTKKRDGRPAFSNPPAAPAPVSSPSKSYAFAPTTTTATTNAALESYQEHDDYDDEVVVGYTTAVISCALSLVLGFGLGYGT